jgi:molecular chaperone GrpE
MAEEKKTLETRSQSASAAGNGMESATATDELIGRMEQELADANERVLRVQAELENYRKRARREMEDERKFAIIPFAKDLLSVVDNLQRAIDAANQAEGDQGLLDGVKMVASQLEAVLSQHQCVRIADVGEPFDPNQHQAIRQEPSTEYPAGTVSRAFQSGYKLHERVIRPAQVFVSSGPPPG